MARVILSCNPLIDEQCLVSNVALNSELTGLDLVNYKISGDVKMVGDGYEMVINKRYENPIIESRFSILYGKVECDIKAASGLGIISSFYLQSDDLDEIDVAEVFGNNVYEFQTNFFIKGNTTTWDRGAYHPLPNPLENFNRYTMEWTPDVIKWFINDQLVRTLDSSNKYGIPKSPMKVKLSLWAGGDPGNSKGTIDWAGAISNYIGLPYTMKIRNLYASDYSNGTYYVYGHSKGEWVNLSCIEGVVGGRVNGYTVEPDPYLPVPNTDRNLANGNQSDESDAEVTDCETELDRPRNHLSSLMRLSVWFVIEIAAFFLWF